MKIKAMWSLLVAFLFVTMYSALMFAQDVVPAASPSPVQVGGASSLSPGDFLSQVLAAIQGFGGLSALMKIAAVITLLVASMKVSYLNSLIWSKLGKLQIWVGPLLGLVAGVLGLGAGGVPITLARVFAYMSAGVGAVFIHELLDMVKVIPGLGPLYVTVITLIESTLGGPAAQAPQPPVVK